MDPEQSADRITVFDKKPCEQTSTSVPELFLGADAYLRPVIVVMLCI